MVDKPFPPPGQTSSCTIIPSYLYEQYFDDDDLQGFVTTYNQLAQQYASWFCDIGLPIYTGYPIAGPLLDWVAEGLYGYPRPSISTGHVRTIGPLNTWQLNTMKLNDFITLGSINFFPTTDDIYKRMLTWHFYKGDGKTFSVRWLKRRVMRFLLGMDGVDQGTDDTSPVSVSFGSDNNVTIIVHVADPITTYNATILQAAIESTTLALPFQYNFNVNLT